MHSIKYYYEPLTLIIKLLSMTPLVHLLRTRFALTSLFFAFSFLFVNNVFGQATVVTDKEDYLPGDTLVITGTGWQPGEVVQLHLVESPSLCTLGHNLYATADANGEIYNNQ